MTQNSLVDVLAGIRYRLRHAAINDELLEWLEENIEALRSRYRRNSTEFKTDDIAFLKRLSVLIPQLSQYLAFERHASVLKRGERLITELEMLGRRVDQINDESFSLVSKQCFALQREVADLYKTPNPSVERDASPQGGLRPPP